MQRFYFLFVLISICVIYSYAQNVPATSPVPEQALENLTENNDDVETEDDSYLQEMHQFITDPVNLNYADENELNQLKLLNSLQIHSLLSYRELLGNFISIYELQAIPGWTLQLIRKIRPYITVDNSIKLPGTLKSRFKNGEYSLLARVTQVLEKSKGYLSDRNATSNFYPGSSQKLLVRYKYQYKNVLQYGITAEKDAGEQFFRGKQKFGFDFYSAHFFVRDVGIIKSLALGDFLVNMGQGLIQWQSLAFKKGSDLLNIKRQDDVLRPYNSAGEIIFNRGAGITLQKKSLQGTAFISYRKLDANFHADPLNNNEDYVSSLQTSGYHRTNSEIADKNTQGQLTFGGNLAITKSNFHLGFNGIHYAFKYPIIKSSVLYNRFALTGTSWSNYSVDYSYTLKNVHFFGEAACDKNLSKAFVNGILISTDAHVDMSFVYRNISRSYQSLYTNAFTESTFPNNESGFYTGITINPTDAWKIDAYADLYSFPWLKFRINAPTAGKDYFTQLTYKPSKLLEIYSRYRKEQKAINYNIDNLTITPAIVKPKQSWRTQLTYKISAPIMIRSRIEFLWYDKKGEDEENGFLTYVELIYKPPAKSYSANARLQYFKTDGYNSRLYTYENDVLYSFSIPVFYDKGYHYYLNFNYDLSRKISLWFRYAQYYYPDKKSIGSGLDEISSNKKKEFKIQALINF